jgi:Tat protein secretion system quality control protein TatD with DNase activity
VGSVVAKVAEIKGLHEEDARAQLFQNAKNLFGIEAVYKNALLG